ncbi:MAG: bifunctional UDP-N-acetylmuramoyl-tripeptide:D-alanyl-D-alanine ligase/alanine racemase [Chlorobi bacterium]|nr:bifunctional UDP-N-acetylmuramoyl-tripeptide:D-alanyl-D-alanine ligase/alanine racemase [Chlorobiota bacterium]
MKKGYKLSEIAEITGGSVIGNGALSFTELLTDSRRVVYADNALFIALKGPNHDGHRYLKSLYHQKVRAYLVERLPENTEDFPCAGFVIVKNTLKALQQIAGCHRNDFKNPLIAITGSNGKTMVKEWLANLLAQWKTVVRSPGSYNSQVGVPLSLWMLDNGYDFAVIEAGISHPGEMVPLENIIRPDIGIFTNIGDAHQENFTSLQQKLDEKLRLFIHTKTLIFRADDNHIYPVVKAYCKHHNIRLFTWGRREENDVQILEAKPGSGKTSIMFRFKKKVFMPTIPFSDNASFENSMHVLTMLLFLGLDPEDVVPRLSGLQPVAMRMEMREGVNDCLLINDYYNSDFYSLTTAMGFLDQQTGKKRHTLILSDILQSGKQESELYSDVAAMVREQGIVKFIGVGETLSRYRNLFRNEATFYPSTETYLQAFREDDFENEVILIKGARDFHFEDISARLELQVHKTVLEVNLDALAHNLNVYRKLLSPEIKIMVMVKALSYGSGAWEIAQALEYQQVDFLAVAYPDEGVALRNAGIRIPVVVMNADISGIRQLVKHNLEPVIYSKNQFEQFKDFFTAEGIYHYPVHLKIDTGMHRLGFLPEECDWLGNVMVEEKTMYVRSIFSHLAASDHSAHDAFTREQIEKFRGIACLILKKLPYKPLLHILNTAGIERFPEARMDMVRLGLGLYGISHKLGNKLRPVSTFKSVVSQIKQIKAGDTVGYDRLEKAHNRMTIAVIPVGYADGLPVQLGNRKGSVIINGHKVPLVGRICMDMCMADVTGINAGEGDVVEIFGSKLPVTEICELAGTIPYDILTGISARVKRNYIRE